MWWVIKKRFWQIRQIIHRYLLIFKVMACKKRWILLIYNYVQFMFCRFAHVRNKMEGRNNIWKKAWQFFPNKVINVNNINKHIDYHFYNLIKNQMKTSVDILYLMSPWIPNNFNVFVILSIVFECSSPVLTRRAQLVYIHTLKKFATSRDNEYFRPDCLQLGLKCKN